MNGTKFAEETILRLVTLLKKSREKKNSKDYRTLCDSLRESMNILINQEQQNRINVFLGLLHNAIETELDQLAINSDVSLENLNVRENHDYILSYAKLDSLNKNIERSLSSLNKRSNFEYHNNNLLLATSIEKGIELAREHLFAPKEKTVDTMKNNVFTMGSTFTKVKIIDYNSKLEEDEIKEKVDCFYVDDTFSIFNYPYIETFLTIYPVSKVIGK